MAAKEGKLNTVEYLIDKGNEIDSKDAQGVSMIYIKLLFTHDLHS